MNQEKENAAYVLCAFVFYHCKLPCTFSELAKLQIIEEAEKFDECESPYVATADMLLNKFSNEFLYSEDTRKEFKEAYKYAMRKYRQEKAVA